MPRTSVVVPTCNRAHLLRETLPTLLAQTEQDLEIVIVDNASTDGTAALIEAGRDPRLRLVRSDRQVPQMENWTRAIHAARGDYVALYHDDDLYAPDIVARSRAFLEGQPTVGMVHVGARRFGAGRRDLGPWRAARRDFVRSGRAEALRWIATIHDVVPSSTMVRRALYATVGGFEPDLLCADFDLYVRMALVTDIGFIAGPLLSVRVHDASTTDRMGPGRWVDEVERLLPRFRTHLAAAGVIPPAGWPSVERRLRARFARRLQRLELSLLARGESARAAEAHAAAHALDGRLLSRLLAGSLALLDRPAGRRLLGLARAAR